MDSTNGTKYGVQSESVTVTVPPAPAPPPGQALPGQQVVQWMPQPAVRKVSTCLQSWLICPFPHPHKLVKSDLLIAGRRHIDVNGERGVGFSHVQQ